jgi:tetratricopeptide (TPR) repeat protein
LNPANKHSFCLQRRPFGAGVVLYLFLLAFLAAQESGPGTLQRYYQEAQNAMAEKRLDAAARAYDALTRLDPNTAENYAQLGLIRYIQGNFVEAAPAFRKALALKPGLPQADVLLAICLSELGRYVEAEPGLIKGFQRPPDAATKRLIGLELVRSYSRLKRWDKAVQIAVKLTQLYPDDPEVLYHVGRLHGDVAYQTMMRLSKAAPDSIWVHQAAGEAHEVQGHGELAIVEYQQVAALDPGRPGIHFRLGRVLCLREDPASRDQARREFEKELQIDPTNAGAAYEIGEILRKNGELEKARDSFADAVQRQSDFEEAHIGLARTLVELNEPKKALPYLEAALRLNTQNEVSHYQLSMVYKALGKTTEQQKELDLFRRLREQRRSQQKSLAAAPFNLEEVTRQSVDTEAP